MSHNAPTILAIIGLVAVLGIGAISGGLTGLQVLKSTKASSTATIKACAQSCADVALANADRCSRDVQKCDLLCKGEHEDIGEQILCQASCPSQTPCLRDALLQNKVCVQACK